jgi:hypothetical protein
MCDGASEVAVATMIISAASAAMTVDASQKNADYQNQMNERQRQQTLANAAANNTEVNLEGQQTRAAAAQKLEENNRAAAIGIAKAKAAGGATGVEGNSVDALLGDLSGVQTRYNNSIQTNYDSSVNALENQRLNIYSNAASTINGLKTPLQPDYITAGLKVAQAGVTYQDAINRQGTTTTTTVRN